MPNTALTPFLEKALGYFPYLLIGAVILSAYVQCEATSEAQKAKKWRLDQCLTEQSNQEKLCIKGRLLYSEEFCKGMAARLKERPSFLSADCIRDEGKPTNL